MRRTSLFFARLIGLAVIGAGLGFARTQEPAKPAEQDQAAKVAPSVGEKKVTGTVELGYRWAPRLLGNERVYRSIVNLGEGPKLFGATLSFLSPKPRLFDRLEVQALSWGGEPYNTARLDMGREGAYSLLVNYRRLDYFNILPSFANPLLALGSDLSQNGRDIQRRLFDTELDLFPNRRFAPFFSYSRTSGSGPGLNTFVGPGNEYLINTRLDDALDMARAGVHLNLSRARLTIEAGGTWFRDDQRLFYDAGPNPGNRRTPLLGEIMRLDRAEQLYRSEGNTFFARLSGQWRAAPFLDLFGQFSFSQPSLDFSLQQATAGNFVRSQALQRFSAETTRAGGDALRPQPSANLSMELRPIGRLRIVESWQTDRFHVSSGSSLLQSLTGVTGLQGSTPPATVQLTESAFRFFTADYNRHQVEATLDLHAKIALRGGHRYEWADMLLPQGPTPAGDIAPRGRQQRSVGLAGLQVRPKPELSLQVDAEASTGDSVFLRTALYDYHKVRVRGRWRPRPWFSAAGSFSLLQNSNDRRDIDSNFRSYESGFNIFLAPREGKRFSLLLDYSRTVLDSALLILLPPFFEQGRSLFEQDAHTAGAFCNLAVARGARVQFGGSLLVSDGTRPTRFYQPRVEWFVPLTPRLGWTSEWRWYGFREDHYRFESFTSHLFSVGLRLTL